MKIKQFSDIGVILLLLCSVALPFLSWLLWSLGLPVRSMYSSEGLRWMFQHAPSLTFSPVLYNGILLVGAYAVWHRIWQFCATPSLSRFAWSVTFVLLFLYSVLVALSVWSAQSPLLSITGSLPGSPLLNGLPSVTLSFMILLGLLHALLLRMVGNMRAFVQLLCAGFTDCSACLAAMCMLSYCIVCMEYILGT